MPDWGLSTQPSGSSGWGDLLDRGLKIIGNYLEGDARLPEGTDVDMPGVGFGSGDPISTAVWRQGGGGGYSQLATLVVPSPDGRIGFWKASGRPLLFSGDLAACKRVARVAMRASRAIGHRRSSRGKR